MSWAAPIFLAAALLATPAQAWTCADVRALSAAQRQMYIALYGITNAQQQAIRAACYGNHGQRSQWARR